MLLHNKKMDRVHFEIISDVKFIDGDVIFLFQK